MNYFKACCFPGKLALGISEVFCGPAPHFGLLVLFTELSRAFPKSLGSPNECHSTCCFSIVILMT